MITIDVLLNYLGLIIVLLGVLLFVIFTILTRRGMQPELRPLKGYQTLGDLVGQAIESGGRTHISLGENDIVGEKTGVTLAGLAVLDIAAEASTISDNPPLATTADATALYPVSDTIRRAYKRAESTDRFDPASARLVAFDSMTLAGGVTSLITDEDVQANLLIGSFGAEVTLMAEAGKRKGILQTIGSDRVDGQAAAYVLADNPLIGEELYMARAYLTQKPSDMAAMAVQDILRWGIIALIIAGVAWQMLAPLG